MNSSLHAGLAALRCACAFWAFAGALFAGAAWQDPATTGGKPAGQGAGATPSGQEPHSKSSGAENKEEAPKPFRLGLKALTDKDGNSSIGVEFNFDLERHLDLRNAQGIPTYDASAFLTGSGNVAFDAESNPNDLIQTKGGGSFAAQVGDAGALMTLRCEAHGGYETNQEFTARNATFGGSLYLVPMVDNGHWLATYNIFDLPFRLLRLATNYNPDNADRGLAYPLLRASLERVAPSANDPRKQAGDTSDFTRLELEANMQVPFMRLGDYHLDLEVDYRVFQELDASAAVKGADQDRFDNFIAVLRLGQPKVSIFGLERVVSHKDGWFLSYRTGRLPFDVEDGDVVEVGWSTYF